MYLAYFWTLSALVGLVVTTRNLVVSYRGYRLLRHKPASEGVQVMAFSHVRTHAIMIWMHLTFVIVGVMAAIPHAPGSVEAWTATGVVMSIPLLLIVLSVTAAMDREKAGKSAS